MSTCRRSGMVDEAPYRRLATAQIGDHEYRFAPVSADARDDVVPAGLIATRDDDDGARLGERSRNGDAETAGGTRDKCCSALQPRIVWTHESKSDALKMDPQVQNFTAKGRATRQRIIDGAAAEIRVNGAMATTLDDVLARTATSKSQLFHYFPQGKEQLLLAVAEQEAARVLSDQQPHLSQLTSWAAWQRWRDVVVDRYRRQGQQCPLSTVMSEIGRTPGAQAVTSTLIDRWRADIEAGVRIMQRQGKVAESIDASRAAAALLAGIQGGVSVLLNTGDLSYLEAALDVGIAGLRG